MKHLKRRVRSALCATLCLALGAALVPFAAAEDAVDTYIGEISGPPISMAAVDDPNAPIITKQPFSETRYVQNGKSFEMRVEAQLPEGVEGELSYTWYKLLPDNTYELVGVGATAIIQTKQFELDTADDTLSRQMIFSEIIDFIGSDSNYYCVVVTNTYQDAEGNTLTAETMNDGWIIVRKYPGMFGSVAAVFRGVSGPYAAYLRSGLAIGLPFFSPLYLLLEMFLVPTRIRQSRAERAYQQYWAS